MKLILNNLIQKKYLLFAFIILLGSFLRLEALLTNSFAFTYDVGRDMLALSDIVTNHKLSLIGQTTGVPGVFYGPWWYLMLTPFFLVFSGNPQGIAFAMVLAGILTIVLSFYLGSKISGSFLALCLIGLVSFSPNMIFLSSQIWNPNIAPFFVVLTLIILYKIYEQKSLKNYFYFLLGLILFLTLDLEIVFGVLFLTAVLISLTLNSKLNFKKLLYIFIGGFIVLLPRILFELRHDFIMTNSFIKYFSTNASSNISFTQTVLNRVNVFFNEFNYTLASGNCIIGFLALLFIVVALITSYKKSNKLIKKFINTTLIVFITFFLGTIFFSHDIWPHYLVGLPVFYVLIFSISLVLLKDRMKSFALPLILLFSLLIINFNPIKVLSDFNKPWEGDASVYRNQIGVVDYVFKEANGNKFKYVVYTPPVHDYTYRYLFSWYGKKTFNYTPSEKADLAFFILEPDIQYPDRLTNWLDQRKGDGKIIKTEKLKGGIIVQTRKP